jgi:hypothetical protein
MRGHPVWLLEGTVRATPAAVPGQNQRESAEDSIDRADMIEACVGARRVMTRFARPV